MSSYVDRGNKLIASGKTQEAMKLVERGLQHYSEKIINAISPYAKAVANSLCMSFASLLILSYTYIKFLAIASPSVRLSNLLNLRKQRGIDTFLHALI